MYCWKLGGPCHTTGRPGEVEGRGQVKVKVSPSSASRAEMKSKNSLNLYVTNRHSHSYHLDESICIVTSNVSFLFYFSMKFMYKQTE